MEKAIDQAIKSLAEQIVNDIKSHDALHYTQAALNLAQIKAILTNIKNGQDI